MIPVTYLPVFVTALFRGMPGVWKSRHRLLLCWLIVMDAGRGHVVALAPSAQGGLLGRPCVGGVVGADGPEHVAAS